MKKVSILFVMFGLFFISCGGDKNACESFYNSICSEAKYFDEVEEYYYQQKVHMCNCVKNKRANFTDYEKIECDRFLRSIEELDESVDDQRKVLQNCSVGNYLLDKYKDLFISTCLLRNGLDNCNNSKKDCIKNCPTTSDEKYKGCISECNSKFPCDSLCDGFTYQ